MVLFGALINGICIVAGTLLGKLFQHIPEKMRLTVMHGIGLAVTMLGIQMGVKSEQFLIVIIGLVFGAILGEAWQIENRLNLLGTWIEGKLGTRHQGNIAKGFVTATLIFVIGAMAVIGALDSGLRGDHRVLYTKAIIDGFISIILTTTLGIGVIFSAIPVFFYEGIIALCASQIDKWVSPALLDAFIVEITSTGGIMITAIGLNLTGITNIRVANLLPAILITGMLVPMWYYWGGIFQSS